MPLIKNIFRLIIIIFLLIIIFVIDLFSQTIEVEFVWPGSMHATHSCAKDVNESNGGHGLLATINGVDKRYNLGIGRIHFINSLDDPGYVDVFQLMRVKFEYKYLNFGASIWKMWIYGYFNNDEPIVLDMPPLPSFFIGVNPFYLINKNVFISYRYVNFVTVSINFFTISYRF